MHLMRESWTDDRLDDLNTKVDCGFAETKDEFTMLRADMKEEFTAVRAEIRADFERVDQRFERLEERLDDRFDGLHRLMIQFCGLMIAALLGLVVPLIGLVATKL